jgi:hypothetical protein
MAMTRLRARIVCTVAAAALGLLASGAMAGAAGAAVTVGGTGAAAAAPEWSAPQLVDPAAGFTALSCASASFCMAFDQNGNFLTCTGTSWSAPSPLAPPGTVTSVWCTSPVFCAAVTSVGYVFTWNGSTWASPWNFADSLDSVWCSSSTTCYAGGTAGTVYWSSGSSWQSTGGPGLTVGPPTFVAGLGVAGAVLAMDSGIPPGSRWSTLTIGLAGVTWSPPAVIVNATGITALSCFGQGQCVAVATGSDGKAYYTLYSGGSWTPPAPAQVASDGPGLTAVSCVSGSFCVAGDTGGNTTTWNGSAWSAPQGIDPAGGGITGASCVSTTFCAAVDKSGHAMTYSVPATQGMTVSAVSPAQVAQGTRSFPVTITGSGLTPGSAVSVTDSTPGISFSGATVVSATTIDAKVTAAATAALASSSVTVSQSGATATCAGCLAVAAPPAMTALSVPKLARGASHSAVITGTGFYPGAKIRFTGPGRGVTATVTSVSSTSITATIKAARTAPVGQYSAVMASGDGGKATLTGALTVVMPPVITRLSPSTVVLGGFYATFTITGTGFTPDATVTMPANCGFFATVSPGGTTISGILDVTSAPPVGTGLPVTVTNGPDGGYGTATDPRLTINTG